MTQNPNQDAPPNSPPPPPPGTPDAHQQAQPPGQTPGQPAPAAGPVGPESDDARSTAMLIHLLAIFTMWLVPLIIWLVKKDQSRFIDQQGKEVVNFELTLMIGMVLGALTFCIGVGVFIWVAVWVVNIVFGILSTIEVNQGKPYRYPVCIRFIS